jgi:hypothetical protein
MGLSCIRQWPTVRLNPAWDEKHSVSGLYSRQIAES